jgi:hypothetical protein
VKVETLERKLRDKQAAGERRRRIKGSWHVKFSADVARCMICGGDEGTIGTLALAPKHLEKMCQRMKLWNWIEMCRPCMLRMSHALDRMLEMYEKRRGRE